MDLKESEAFLPDLQPDGKNIKSRLDRPKRKSLAWLGLICLGITIIAVFMTFKTLLQRLDPEDSQHIKAESSVRPKNCGGSPVIARERGCAFDIIGFSWVMPECFDAELTAEFRNRFQYKYYEEDCSQQEVPYEVALLG